LLLQLTPAGRALLAKSPETAQSRIIAALEKMPERRRVAQVDALESLVETLGMAGAAPTLLLEPVTDSRWKRQRK